MKVKEIEAILARHIRRVSYRSFGMILNELDGYEAISLYQCETCDLAFFWPMVTGSEEYYRQLAGFDWYYMSEKNEYEYVRRYVRPCDAVLEVGCGKGLFARGITLERYVGLELSPEAIRRAGDEGIRVLNESVEWHAIGNREKYDIVTAFQVLEHVANVKAFIEGCVACVRSGGLVIFSVPSYDSFVRYAVDAVLDMPPHHVTRWSDRALASIGKIHDLEMVDLWHEPLQAVHKSFYAQTVVSGAFYHALKRRKRSIAMSGIDKLIARAAALCGRVLVGGLDSAELLPRGVSVTAVYKKTLKR